MTASRSLTSRLILSSAAWVIATLLISGLLLLLLFRDHIERRFDAMLYDHLEELVAASELDLNGELTLTWIPFDPRFNRPHSGWYWQVSQNQVVVARSDSLWRDRLAIKPPQPVARGQIQNLTGPADEPARALVQSIELPDAEQAFIFAVAGPVSDIDRDVAGFTTQLALTLGTVALGLSAAVLLQIRVVLKPLRRLGQALTAIRTGHSQRMPTSFPPEIQPVVTELNTLLAHNASVLERARSQAGNLGHALKNPLTVIRNEAHDVGGESGAVLRTETRAMTNTIDRYLSHARAAGSRGVLGANTQVAKVVEDLRFSLERLYRDRALRFDTSILDGLVFQGDAQDLEEILGNLMDNACKWASSTVKVSIQTERCRGRICIVVDDDGPGVADEELSDVLRRGQRLDEQMPGHGLGLAIVSDLVNLYHGSLTLERSPLGGLRSVLELPGSVA